jgi:hypothetical protein
LGGCPCSIALDSLVAMTIASLGAHLFLHDYKWVHRLANCLLMK